MQKTLIKYLEHLIQSRKKTHQYHTYLSNRNLTEKVTMIYSEFLKEVTWNIITGSDSGLNNNFFY